MERHVFSSGCVFCFLVEAIHYSVLRRPECVVWSSFWDAGLLELDRLKQLRSVDFTIRDEHIWQNPLVQTYHADFSGSASEPRKLLHSIRDRVRLDRGYDASKPSDLDVTFRCSPNPCPLYVSNLIRSLPRRGRSNIEIHYGNMLNRQCRPRLLKAVLDVSRTEDAEKRERLARKLATREPQLRPRRLPQSHTGKADTTRSGSVHVDRPLIDYSPRGHWRRLLNEETYAPFFERFPPAIENHARGNTKGVEAVGCFLHAWVW
jgi:hypothetical protein